MKKFLLPILAVIVFLFMQAAAGIVIAVVGLAMHPEMIKSVKASGNMDEMMNSLGTDALSWAIVICGILTIVVIALLKMIDWKRVLNLKMIDWTWGFIGIVAAFFGIYASNIMEEMLNLPNLMEDTFLDMSNSVAGVLSVGVLGPIIEEFIFREGVEGYMLRNGVNKWVAIFGSALAFGIIHLNPAQVPFAAVMGIILGIIYYKSGNIVLTSILHILNNSIAVWEMYSMGEELKDFSMVEWMGGTGISIAVMAVCIFICVFLLMRFWKKYQKQSIQL